MTARGCRPRKDSTATPAEHQSPPVVDARSGDRLLKLIPLADPDPEGDPKFTTDFRSLYAGLLEKWLGVPSAPVLGDSFPPMKFTT